MHTFPQEVLIFHFLLPLFISSWIDLGVLSISTQELTTHFFCSILVLLLHENNNAGNTKNSRALQLVKAAEYSKVPNSMLDFNKGTVGYSRRPVTRRDYIERGQMYGELFQTPDSIALPSFEEGTSFGAMAKVIKFTRLG